MAEVPEAEKLTAIREILEHEGFSARAELVAEKILAALPQHAVGELLEATPAYPPPACAIRVSRFDGGPDIAFEWDAEHVPTTGDLIVIARAYKADEVDPS